MLHANRPEHRIRTIDVKTVFKCHLKNIFGIMMYCNILFMLGQ